MDHSSRIYLGIDPGYSGAVVAILQGKKHTSVAAIRLKETEADIARFVLTLKQASPQSIHCMLEKVNAFPKQGVASTFKFGTSYGFCRGLLIAYRIPFQTVTPAKWQQQMRCRSAGDKNVTKARAQELFPEEQITHAVADALLLAELCRRTQGEK